MICEPAQDETAPPPALHDDDLARIDDLMPIWQRFGPEGAEERRAAACRLLLDLAPEGPIERILAVNLLAVQAAGLDCLRRGPSTVYPGILSQGARLIELSQRLARELAREQKARHAAQATEAAEREAEARAAREERAATGLPDAANGAAPLEREAGETPETAESATPAAAPRPGATPLRRPPRPGRASGPAAAAPTVLGQPRPDGAALTDRAPP